VTQGYFRNEKATKDAFRNGWFATGDVAVDRDGKFYIVDRIKVFTSEISCATNL
jgi:4-coumarate--CoA ligase